jgi:hypothetical protein
MGVGVVFVVVVPEFVLAGRLELELASFEDLLQPNMKMVESRMTAIASLPFIDTGSFSF